MGWVIDTIGLLVLIAMGCDNKIQAWVPSPVKLLHYLVNGRLSCCCSLLRYPLRGRMGWPRLGQNRRLIGLFAFAYMFCMC